MHGYHRSGNGQGKNIFKVKEKSGNFTFMYRFNQNFNIPPLPGNPFGHLTFLKIIIQIPPYPGQNAVQIPYTRVHSGDQMPPLGTFHRHKNDRGTAETPSVVEQNLYKYNKNWETLLAYLLRTKVSCKAAENAATRWLNAQLFFVCHATYEAFYKKNPTYHDHFTDMHHRSPYTCGRSK